MDTRDRVIYTAEELFAKSGNNPNPEMIKIRRRLTEAEKTRKKVGRNAPFPCGSGKKLKNCCLPRVR
jgi:uncharacterized protein YecA (UPF0149 family)